MVELSIAKDNAAAEFRQKCKDLLKRKLSPEQKAEFDRINQEDAVKLKKIPKWKNKGMMYMHQEER